MEVQRRSPLRHGVETLVVANPLSAIGGVISVVTLLSGSSCVSLRTNIPRSAGSTAVAVGALGTSTAIRSRCARSTRVTGAARRPGRSRRARVARPARNAWITRRASRAGWSGDAAAAGRPCSSGSTERQREPEKSPWAELRKIYFWNFTSKNQRRNECAVHGLRRT